MRNSDERVVEAFGEEWQRFPQSSVAERDLRSMFADFFSIFPWSLLPPEAIGADFGCGSGRWAKFVAPRVGTLHLIDASDAALAVAKHNLDGSANVVFHHASVEEVALADSSLDFGYSLGVLHHVPDTRDALTAAVGKLKPGAPFLIYLYYAFDNRPTWFKMLWRASDLPRRMICRLPKSMRFIVCDLIALGIYWPLARLGRLLDAFGIMPSSWPLAWYRDRTFYVMRTDALDRFGTRLEKRFSRAEIERLLHEAGLGDVQFSAQQPFWCAVGFKGRNASSAPAERRANRTT